MLLSEVEETLYEMDDDDEELDDDAEYFETTCPVCQEEIVFDEDTLDSGEIRCPNCGESWSLTSAIWPGLRMTTTTRTNPMTEKGETLCASPFNLAKSMCFFCQRIGGLTDSSPRISRCEK